MSIFELIASLVDSLAWPVAVSVLAIAFRKPLAGVLRSLTALRYKGLEADFKRGLEELEESVKEIEQAEPKAQLAPGEASENGRSISEEIEAVAGVSPVAAVPLAWTAVESEILATVERLAISADYPPYVSAVKHLGLLREHTDLDVEILRLLDRMRRLRNMVVHPVAAEGAVSYEEAREYGAFAEVAIRRLRRLRQVPTRPNNKLQQTGGTPPAAE